METATALAALAEEIGCSAAQLALAWLCRRSATRIIPIIGARNVSQLEENIQAVNVELTDDHIARLDALTAPTVEYPQSLFVSEFFQTMMYGEVRYQMDFPGP